MSKRTKILLIDDDIGDVELSSEFLLDGAVDIDLETAADGVEAIDMLRDTSSETGSGKPDLIIMDLNMPRKDGRELLAEVKSDPALRAIPPESPEDEPAAKRQEYQAGDGETAEIPGAGFQRGQDGAGNAQCTTGQHLQHFPVCRPAVAPQERGVFRL